MLQFQLCWSIAMLVTLVRLSLVTNKGYLLTYLLTYFFFFVVVGVTIIVKIIYSAPLDELNGARIYNTEFVIRRQRKSPRKMH